MVGKSLIKLRSNLAEFWKVSPGDTGEVMVLGVVAKVEIDIIKRAEIIIGF